MAWILVDFLRAASSKCAFESYLGSANFVYSQIMKSSVLPPFPNGWYAVAFSEELLPSAIINKQFMGREVVLFRTANGKAALIDAYCPHLGAHFGHGGKIVEETIECPFHAFRFNTEGKCVQTGYGTRPSPTCTVGSYPLREWHGTLMVWFDDQGRPPHWELPVLDTVGWTPMAWRKFELDCHPQETSENSVDLGHFSIVHKYQNVGVLEPMQTDGPRLWARYTFARKADFMFATNKTVRTEFTGNVYGLGCSYVETEIVQFNLITRQWVFAMPTTAGKMEMRIGMSMKFLGPLAKVHPLLAILPRKFAIRLIASRAIVAYAHDVKQDFDVWNNKVYVHPPSLAQGDGPIVQYRKWCRQFYSEYESVPVEHANS